MHVAFTRYLQPAIDACSGSNFVLPLSLAVIYDSVTHGSYEKIKVRVTASAVPSPAQRTPKGVTLTQEKAWITAYIRERDAWLASIPRLNSTRYRTKFFLNQIALGRWQLELPLNANGFRLEAHHIQNLTAYADGFLNLAVGPNAVPQLNLTNESTPAHPPKTPVSTPQAQPPTTSTFTEIGNGIYAAAERIDAVDRLITTVVTRTDRAKSLWTTVVGMLWQILWAVFGFFAGVPREVWFVVAIIAATLMLAYLYRQIELGKIRETK